MEVRENNSFAVVQCKYQDDSNSWNLNNNDPWNPSSNLVQFVLQDDNMKEFDQVKDEIEDQKNHRLFEITLH